MEGSIEAGQQIAPDPLLAHEKMSNRPHNTGVPNIKDRFRKPTKTDRLAARQEQQEYNRNDCY